MLDAKSCAMVLGHWSEHGCDDVTCAPYCLGDITGDGIVDGADFNELLGAWGVCP
jgi:hypothetical protein